MKKDKFYHRLAMFKSEKECSKPKLKEFIQYVPRTYNDESSYGNDESYLVKVIYCPECHYFKTNRIDGSYEFY